MLKKTIIFVMFFLVSFSSQIASADSNQININRISPSSPQQQALVNDSPLRQLEVIDNKAFILGQEFLWLWTNHTLKKIKIAGDFIPSNIHTNGYGLIAVGKNQLYLLNADTLSTTKYQAPGAVTNNIFTVGDNTYWVVDNKTFKLNRYSKKLQPSTEFKFPIQKGDRVLTTNDKNWLLAKRKNQLLAFEPFTGASRVFFDPDGQKSSVAFHNDMIFACLNSSVLIFDFKRKKKIKSIDVGQAQHLKNCLYSKSRHLYFFDGNFAEIYDLRTKITTRIKKIKDGAIANQVYFDGSNFVYLTEKNIEWITLRRINEQKK